MGATTLRLPDELHARLAAFAKRFGMSLNASVAFLVERQLNEIERNDGVRLDVNAVKHLREQIALARRTLESSMDSWKNQIEVTLDRLEREASE